MKNKKEKIKSPINLLIVIVNRHKGDSVVAALNEKNITAHVNCMGYGTSESGIADLFGFGIIERDIVASLVPSTESKNILEELNGKFNFDEPHNGLAFTVPVNSIEKKLFDFIKVN